MYFSVRPRGIPALDINASRANGARHEKSNKKENP